MKFLFPFFFLLLGSAKVFSQSPLDKQANFAVEQVNLSTTLDNLSQETGIDIAYSSRFFSPNQSITFRFSNTRVETILETILAGTGIAFQESDGSILLFRPKPKIMSGYVVDKESGEALVAATIYHPRSGTGTFTNEYGFFSIPLPEGAHDLHIRYVGYTQHQFRFDLQEDMQTRIELEPSLSLAKVEIFPNGQREIPPILRAGQGVLLTEKLMQASPTLGGLEDPVRTAQMLPGVDAGGDGTAGLHVRGSNPGHNLMLMDGVPIFIPFHLLGIFSVYNSNAIKSARLYKGDFTARYGGRLGSVFDVRIREGDLYSWHGDLSLNLNLAEATIEGPIKKGKAAILVSNRSAPSSFIFGPTFERTYFPHIPGQLESHFRDMNAKINWIPGPKDRLFLSFFTGSDSFGKELKVEGTNTEAESEIEWSNTAFALRWNHLFSHKLFANTTATFSRFLYQYTTYNKTTVSPNSNALESLFFIDNRSINTHLGLKTDFDYHATSQHKFRFGLGLELPFFKPAFSYYDEGSDEIQLIDSISRTDLEGISESGELDELLEGHVYLEDRVELGEQVMFNLGMRVSFFQNNHTSFARPEPRFRLDFLPHAKLRAYLAGSRMVQYLHLVSNTAIQFPNDIWSVSGQQLPPQDSWMVETGAQMEFAPQLHGSLDLYYKTMRNLQTLPDSLGYLNSADLNNPSSFFLNGQGTAVGAECMLTYQGKRNYVVASYALSKATRQFDGLNLGQRFPHAYDQRHRFKITYAYQLGKGFQAAMNWVYNSPAPRLELSRNAQGLGLVNASIYPPGLKNRNRGLPYHRLDLNLSYDFGKGFLSHRLKAGLFNVYNRENPSFYENINTGFRPVSGLPITPSFSYSVRF